MDSFARFYLNIDLASGSLTIEAIDSSDNEKLLVQNVRVADGGILFDTIVPSSGYKISHKWSFASSGNSLVQVTLEEIWEPDASYNPK